MTEKPQNHPGTTAVLSFIFNGLGQLYNGEIKKGLVIMTVTSIFIMIILIGGILMLHWWMAQVFPFAEFIWGAIIFVVGIIGACAVGAYSIFDAYQKASKQ